MYFEHNLWGLVQAMSCSCFSSLLCRQTNVPAKTIYLSFHTQRSAAAHSSSPVDYSSKMGWAMYLTFSSCDSKNLARGGFGNSVLLPKCYLPSHLLLRAVPTYPQQRRQLAVEHGRGQGRHVHLVHNRRHRHSPPPVVHLDKVEVHAAAGGRDGVKGGGEGMPMFQEQ